LSSVTTVPSLAARAGNLCAPPACETTIPVGVSPLVAPYFGFYPLPNGPIFCPFDSCPAGAGDTAQFSFNGFQNSTENFVTTRIDNKFSDKDNLAGAYNFDAASSDTTDEFKNKLIHSRTRRQIITLEENHIFSPALVNSLRLGFNRVHAASPQGASALNPLAADTALGFVPGETAGVISVPGLTDFSGGLSTQVPQVWDWNSWQANDNAFLTRGTHALKFGANVERIEDNSFSTSRPGGNFLFNSLQDFLTDNPASISVDLPQFVSPRGIRQTIFGTYIQDDVRFRPNLTVNLGLRYEMATVPSEVQGKLSTLLHLTDTQPHTGNPMFSNPTLRNFEPRVGFAWDPFHSGKTSVRGGFGLFDVLPLPIELRGAVFAVWPFFDSASSSTLLPGSFPTGAFLSLAPDASTARHDFFQPNPPRNYVMQWNLNIQRELTPSTTAMIAYVGSRGVHNVLQTDDSNIVLPTLTSQGYLWPYPSGNGTRLNPNIGRISATFFDSDTTYHGLQLQITKRMSHGFQAQGSYTWSKGIDTSSGSTDGDQFLNGISSLFFFDRRLRRGLSDFNVGQNLIINYTWDIPGPRSLSGAAGWALSGWELGGIYQATGGQPFTAILGGDPLGLNNIDPFDFPDRLVGPGCGSLINPGNVNNYIRLQCFAMPPSQNPPSQANQPPNFTLLGNAGRNILIGPGLSNFDMSLFKNNYVKRISESFNVQFRLEVFNIFNRPNFAPPTDNGQNALFDGSGSPIGGAGVLDATTTTSRQIQFAMKVIW
jgi:TonB dependent receptor-like, beta-barrel